MDLFLYNEPYRLWICKPCGHAIHPPYMASHLRKQHRESHLSKTEREQIVAQLGQRPWLDPAQEEDFDRPSPESPPVKGLILYDGIRCAYCHYTCVSEDSMHIHRRKLHKGMAILQSIAVKCQRFFKIHAGSSFFVVTPQSNSTDLSPHAEQSIRDQANKQIDQIQASVQSQVSLVPWRPHDTEMSPWLHRTQWAEYLGGEDLAVVAQLGAKPQPGEHPLLEVIAETIARLVYETVLAFQERRVGQFDQLTINTYMTDLPRVYERPINYTLKEATWRAYISYWQRLFCFIYRVAIVTPGRLRYRLTSPQHKSLQRLVKFAGRLHNAREGQDQGSPDQLQDQVDKACLDLSIALINHTLYGDEFDNLIIGFLAILGVNSKKDGFHRPGNFTSYTAGILKISQMMIVRNALRLVDEGIKAFPGPILEHYRANCLLYGSRTPFAWIVRLRTFGRRIRKQSTNEGSVVWSTDHQTLTYRDLEITIDGFRHFVKAEIDQGQEELNQLLFSTVSKIPDLDLSQLRDNPSNFAQGWNFLHHEENKEVLRSGSGGVDWDRWLFNRMVDNAELRMKFLHPNQPGGSLHLRSNLAESYLRNVNAFLERLLLLIHVTGGQPIRGTEIISIRYANTLFGESRNIFIESGLVSIATTYHKGASSQGTTKLIHRYLPKCVSKMVVYYLGLVLPFRQQLEAMLNINAGIRSPFLFAKDPTRLGTRKSNDQILDLRNPTAPKFETWSNLHLTTLLQREGRRHLQADLTILSYRHIAIAMSRVYLRSGGFRRDYATEDNPVDLQAGHNTWTAETMYARERDVAPGFVGMRQLRYRLVSEQWHEFVRIQKLGEAANPAPESQEEQCKEPAEQALEEDWDILSGDSDDEDEPDEDDEDDPKSGKVEVSRARRMQEEDMAHMAKQSKLGSPRTKRQSAGAKRKRDLESDSEDTDGSDADWEEDEPAPKWRRCNSAVAMGDQQPQRRSSRLQQEGIPPHADSQGRWSDVRIAIPAKPQCHRRLSPSNWSDRIWRVAV